MSLEIIDVIFFILSMIINFLISIIDLTLHSARAIPVAVPTSPCLIRRLKTKQVKKRKINKEKMKRSPKRGERARHIIYDRGENASVR